MMARYLILVAALAFITATFAESRGATFREGSGVILDEATQSSIGLVLAPVEDALLTPEFVVVAQIYQNTPSIMARAHMSQELARQQEDAGSLFFLINSVTGKVVRLDRTLTPATGRVEALIELPGIEPRPRVGDSVRLRLAGKQKETTVIPAAAVLQTVYGNFAYVQNGRAFLRTAIQTGDREGNRVEILDGLYSGDVVAASAVETLYLIELRATKGGGHSH